MRADVTTHSEFGAVIEQLRGDLAAARRAYAAVTGTVWLFDADEPTCHDGHRLRDWQRSRGCCCGPDSTGEAPEGRVCCPTCGAREGLNTCCPSYNGAPVINCQLRRWCIRGHTLTTGQENPGDDWCCCTGAPHTVTPF